MKDNTKYSKESDLCRDFMEAVRKKGLWTSYPETGGFDILLSNKKTGHQIGIEAKLNLNAKVIRQCLPWRYDFGAYGPDFRAVLVPAGKASDDMTFIARHLGIAVIRYSRDYPFNNIFLPEPQRGLMDDEWQDWCPSKRVKLPEVIPDVEAGTQSPKRLTGWKIKAIKLQILLESRPVTRKDFRALQLSPGLWLNGPYRWLDKVDDGFVASERMPDLMESHPRAYSRLRLKKHEWIKILDVE